MQWAYELHAAKMRERNTYAENILEILTWLRGGRKPRRKRTNRAEPWRDRRAEYLKDKADAR